MKLLYITNVNMLEKSGVASKIQGQIKSMQKQGLDVQLIYSTNNSINYVNINRIKTIKKYKRFPIIGFLNTTKILFLASLNIIKKKKYKAIYIRYFLSNWNSIIFFKKLKLKKIKIFLEIATFPYDQEYKNKSFFKKIGLLIDKYYRKKLKNYIDYCFTPSRVDYNIYGIKTVFFDNAVDIDTIPNRNYIGNQKNTLKLLAVANVSPHHGYDRIIKGIANYYNLGGKKNIMFNIVGDGIELENLKSLTKKLNLENNVIFHNKKFGDELNDIYNFSDIGVGVIGICESNINNISSLKLREYCLKSLPFISLNNDLDFKRYPYVYYVEENNKPINIKNVLNFFKRIKNKNYIYEMRAYAKKNLGWDNKFKNVINTIKSIVH